MIETRFAKPRLRYDDQGRIIPSTPEEREAQVEAIRIMFQEMAAIVDPPDEVTIEEVFRAIDSHRPDYPLFEGMY